MKQNKSKIIYTLTIIGVFVGFYIWSSFSNSDTQNIKIENMDESELQKEKAKIFVHVSGEVNVPGVIEIKDGARIEEVINAAGGMTSQGDLTNINLARKVKDEEKIEILKKEVSENPEKEIKSGLVNINTASMEELKSLPGIGEVLAKNIVTYREENGYFIQLEDLKNVSRIGDKMFENIVLLITV